jgi:hypothetical protein
MSEQGTALAIVFTVVVLTFSYFWEDYQSRQLEMMECNIEEKSDER